MKPIVYLLLVTILTQKSLQSCRRKRKPHIIVIMADDMGHNDISVRGSNQIPTPNIDALAYNGILLDKYYVQNACTPSRTAFLTGNYPIRSGMQGVPIVAGQNRSLPLDMPIMPELLKNLGYETHLVGKWHLGAGYRKVTPTRRGFDTHFGYWHGFTGYFDYMTDYNSSQIEGFDLHDALSYPWDKIGSYATHLFTKKATDIIDNHNSIKPLFLLVTHLAAHTGRDGVELGVPNRTLTDTQYGYIANLRRRLYAGQLDASIGKIITSLSDRNMLEDSIVLFYSDNGAPTVGPYANEGSNWPLRGIKMTNFEGGVRGTGIIFSPRFKKKGYVNSQLIHVSDWLPTFYAAAGGDLSDLGGIDGINQWRTLSLNAPTKRREILININDIENTTSIITNGTYKLITGLFEEGRGDGYFGDSGRSPGTPPYNFSAVLNSATNLAIQTIPNTPPITEQQAVATRNQVDLSWCRKSDFAPFLNCTNGCLFNLDVDPCETNNIIRENVEIARELFQRIDDFRPFIVSQGNLTLDPRANPQRYNNTWCTWLDDDWCPKAIRV